MTTTTNYFESFAKAVQYYSKYMFTNTAGVVRNKREKREIVIGIPPMRVGDKLILHEDGRYSISTKGDK